VNLGARNPQLPSCDAYADWIDRLTCNEKSTELEFPKGCYWVLLDYWIKKQSEYLS